MKEYLPLAIEGRLEPHLMPPIGTVEMWQEQLQLLEQEEQRIYDEMNKNGRNV